MVDSACDKLGWRRKNLFWSKRGHQAQRELKVLLLSEVTSTKADFDQCDWSVVVEKSRKRKCKAYVSGFAEKAREAEASGELGQQGVYMLLNAVCSLMLQLDSPAEPFGPMMVFADRRSAILDDFNSGHLATLQDIVHNVVDPELRARIADVLWCKQQGDYQLAELAVSSYLESARRLEDDGDWVESANRIERASQLAVSLGRSGEPFAEVIAHIEDAIERCEEESPLFHAGRLMRLLQRYGLGDPKKYARLAEQSAIRAEESQDAMKWHTSRAYWQIKAKWDLMGGDEDASRDAEIRAAETHVEEADETLKQHPEKHFVAAAHLGQAIQALRKIKDTRERREELLGLLLSYQRESVAEFGVVSGTIDIREFVERATELVRGKPLPEALSALALSGTSQPIAALKKEVEESAEQSGLYYVIPVNVLDGEGKVAARRSGILGSSEERESALRAEMLRRAALGQSLHAQGVVLPAIAQIRSERNVRITDLLPLVSNNPFVPFGREEIFARGLQAGLVGNLLSVGHLLIPQIEHSLRHLLTEQGVIVSGLDQRGIQEVHSLNTTLYRPELAEILGEDVVFDLQGLLVERFGANLRNRMAHGLMDYSEFYSLDVAYLWWLTLRLCFLFLYAQMPARADGAVGPADGTASNEVEP